MSRTQPVSVAAVELLVQPRIEALIVPPGECQPTAQDTEVTVGVAHDCEKHPLKLASLPRVYPN